MPSLSQTYTVKGPDDLDKIAKALPTSPDVGTTTIAIDYYLNPLQLKVDKPHANVQVLQIQRANSDSEAVIKVESTFIDIRNMTSGTLVLRGLAFKMMNPQAVLIAGADNLKPNHDLLIDSCFIFGDSLASAFLSWLGDANSRIEIRNSWFVMREGKIDLAKMLLNGGSISFSNNLINFPGSIESQSITKEFNFRSNTVNRTQFALNGKLSGGRQPIYFFNRNLFAHRHPYSVFGGDLYYVASLAAFDLIGSTISYNRMYSTWTGFDYQNPKKFSDEPTNKIDAVRDGKDITELWNWYTEALDPITGLLSGTEQRSRYNVMPGVTKQTVGSDIDALEVSFDSAPYPRNFAMTVRAATVDSPAYLRVRYPKNGSLHFGPFQVTKITQGTSADFGKPFLLARDAGAFKLQTGLSKQGENPSIFANALPTAREFILADSANTHRGLDVKPAGISLLADERLSFGRVDTAGHTMLQEVINNPGWPSNIRYLDKAFGFRTNASVNSTITFAAAPQLTPHLGGKDSVYWMQLPSVLMTVTLDSGRIRATTPYDSKTTPVFMAYLVEKLSIPRGETLFSFKDGSLKSGSVQGYQIQIDSAAVYDRATYAEGTNGYRFNWKGRGTADSLILSLKGHPLSQAFVKLPTASPEPLPEFKLDASGNYRIRIGMSDTAKIFFTAVLYNVLPGFPFTGNLPGTIEIEGFASNTGGKLAFAEEDSNFVNTVGTADSAGRADFRNTRFLAGKKNVSYNLTPTGNFSMSFEIPSYQDRNNLEAWYLSGGAWKRLSDSAGVILNRMHLKRLPATATRIVIVERFQAPEIYVAPKDTLMGDTLAVSLNVIGTVNPVRGFCVETKSVDPLGVVTISGCIPKQNSETIRVEIKPDLAYSWRIIYIMGTDADTVRLGRPFKELAGTGWSLKNRLSPQIAVLPKGHWRVLTVPTQGPLGKFIEKISEPDTSLKETTLVLKLKNSGKGTAFDTLVGWRDTSTIPGTGFLFADSRVTKLHFDSLDAVRTAKPETLALTIGWHLVGNPYPIPLNVSKVRSKPAHPLAFRKLTRSDSSVYDWDTVVTRLLPFEGYAYFAGTAETLYFDPGDISTGTSGSVLAKSKPASSPSGFRVKVGLRGGFGQSTMALTTEAGEVPLGFLPTPGAGLELRVGERGGYLIKPVRDFRSLEEPVTITSARAGTAAFTFGESGPGSAMGFALIDETTGAVYDHASARELPLSAGTRAYRLVVGDPGFVADRTRAFLAGAPAEIAMSQNFPNPFRGHTRIALDWPATQAADRKARLEVMDMRGRKLASIPIEGIRMGRQVLSLDASAWKAGLYVYRLTVTAGGRASRLQKRMLVSP